MFQLPKCHSYISSLAKVARMHLCDLCWVRGARVVVPSFSLHQRNIISDFS